MLKLAVKVGSKKISYKPFSISVRYLIEEKKLGQSLENLSKILGLKLSELQTKNFLSESGCEIRAAKHNGKPDEILISRIKIDDKFSADYFRNHIAGLVKNLSNEEIKNLHIFIPAYEPFKKYFNTEDYYYQTFIEGVFLGAYSYDKYLSKKNNKQFEVYFYAGNDKKLKTAVNNTLHLMGGVNFTKDLQNEPAGNLTPQILANKIRAELSKAGVKVTVFDENIIKKKKMGGLLAVGGGSANPPRFILLEYKGGIKRKAGVSKTTALVGKGVTFDTGGISLKPAADMGEMKGDMSGAAVVAGVILAAAKAKLKVDLLGVIPAAENMLSGSAYRPGDIIVTASGKTIEVDNTDAEGRIILADALDYASKLKPARIIDLATLTGACVVALGEFTAGLFTKDDKLSSDIFSSGIKTHDRVWALPMWDDYHSLNKSDVADVKNIGGRWAGAITAAKFLENFVDKNIPWAHLDIAGPASANSLNNYTKKYMTGFGVRLLFDYLLKLQKF
ncbi:MAG: leucyl aminopeptidase [Ignavibacteria bacterium CG2_30_36_16]|nr:leucyl aminopeptidase [Ignavibacteria bacterium]OIP59034.1 MAG: leucyl aminopeptidase [Ignavibacteria bacterium CG2_30_36_16]